MTKKIKVYVKIANDGLIDTEAFALMGASVKKREDSIGLFGSGLKYSLAVLLRHEIDFKVFSGLDEVKIGLQKTTLRGKEFKVILINGNRTSITTEAGKLWKPWFAIREIYANALDEGGKKVITVTNKIKPVEGKTTFFIEIHDKIKPLFNNWNNFFSNKREDAVLVVDKKKVFWGGNELVVYRRGIRAYREKIKCLFHYDFDDLEINESRVLVSTWSFKYDLVKFLGRNANSEIIRKIYDNFQETFEGGLDWSYCSNFNENWLDILGDRKIVLEDVAGHFVEEMDDNTIILPTKLAKAMKEYFGAKIVILGFSDKYGDRKIVKFNSRQTRILKECLDFLKRGGIIFEAEIKLCEFENNSVRGEANSGAVLLSPALFDEGKKEIIAVILEEYAHLDSKAGDKTRRFQNYLLKKYLSLLEEKVGVYL